MGHSHFAATLERIKSSVHRGQSFDVGQVKLVGLDAVKRNAGLNWPTLADRIRENSLAFMQGALGEDDIVIAAGDGFLILFAKTGGRDVDRECDALREALRAFCLGETDMHDLRAEIDHRPMDARSMLKLVGQELTSDPRAYAISFVPVWSVAKEVIGAYFAAPSLSSFEAGAFGYSNEYRRTGRHSGGADFTDLDVELLARAIEGADQALCAGKRCVVGVSVHVTTFQNRARWDKFESAFARIPEPLRPALMAKIAEIEPGTPNITIAEWASRLQRVIKRVGLGLHHTDRALETIGTTRAKTVSLSLSQQTSFGGKDQERWKGVIARWNFVLKRQGLAFCVDGVDNRDLLSYVCDIGVPLATGKRFWPDVPAPCGIQAMPRDSVLGTPEGLLL